jgi:hypothetical protein
MTLPPDEVSAARAEVRRLVGQQNRYIAVGFALGGAALLLATYFGLHSNWLFIVLMVGCPVAAVALWHVRRSSRQRIRCPSCGSLWEHQQFLTWEHCEDCGLPLPDTAARLAEQVDG